MSGSAAERVVVIGSKTIGARVVETLAELDPGRFVGVVTIDDRDDSRTAWDEVHKCAATAGAVVHVASDRRGSEAILDDLAPDLVIVAGWYWILPSRLLDQARCGYVGIHFSLLPSYRGSAPLVWAMLNGDDTVGLTLFRFTPGMDEGPVWGQRQISGVDGSYVGEVLARLEDEAIALLADRYAAMRDAIESPAPQADQGVSYAAPRIPDDGAIDWRRDAADLQRFVRAQSRPYPGAWTMAGDERVTIWRATASSVPWYAAPGQVVATEGRHVLVACGDNRALVVEEVSAGDRQPMAPKDVLRVRGPRLSSPI
jgi:methionyl-tRNA formyltransferase